MLASRALGCGEDGPGQIDSDLPADFIVANDVLLLPFILLLLWVPCSQTSLGDRSYELLESFTIGGHAEGILDIPQPGEILTPKSSFPLDLALNDGLQEPILGSPQHVPEVFQLPLLYVPKLLDGDGRSSWRS